MLVWLSILVFGIASYTTLLKREGFPSINVPFSMVSGAYLVNDPAKVDNDVGKPLSNIITKLDGVKTVDSKSGANFYTVAIEYKEGTDPKAASAKVEEAVKAANVLPSETTAKFEPLSIGVDERGDDMLVAFYPTGSYNSTKAVFEQAQEAANFIKDSGKIPLAQTIEAVDPFVHGSDPVTGKSADSQKLFDRYGTKDDQQNIRFYKSVAIGIKGVKGFDVLELDKQIRSGLDELNSSPQFADYHAQVSYSAAPDINDQVNGLQRSLLDGLVAILVVSALLIAIRASFITVSAMVVVLLTTLGVLYLIGYSLNTITLFSLILCLSLIVDDTIIMVEAIDAQRRRSKQGRETIEKATRKISRAMIAATATATIGFAPLIFVTGILGSFIRAIPVTVIASLLVSLLVALTFIPFLARFLLLRPKQLNQKDDAESPAHHIETFIALTVARPLYWINHNRKRQVSLGLSAVLVGLGFILAGGFLFSKVTFNIFPPTKDSDVLAVQMTFDPNLSIEQTQAVADRADQLIGDKLGENFKQASYYNSGTGQSATLSINLLSFKNREVTAPQLVSQLDSAFKDFKGAQVKVAQADVGPPASAFTVRIQTSDRARAYKLANDLSIFLRTEELVRVSGAKAHMKTVTISNPDTYARNNNHSYIDVSAEFDGTDTTTLVTLAQDAVKQEFNSDKLAGYGLKTDNLVFDIGTEGDFQNSFKNLVFAFPILLVVIYILLVSQFRSLLQPLLIFMAIPFSLFGITGGLWLTHNAFSFFTMLGFFALLGLSIKNTILLTDYANQARQAGSNAVEAVAISLQERFRPLIATSLTAIVSLIPLYLSNPFWEGLTVTLMFGLLSSTFLVVIVFPYYYLGAEYMRLRISRKAFGLWLVINVVLVGALVLTKATKAVPLVILVTTIGLPLVRLLLKRRSKENQ